MKLVDVMGLEYTRSKRWLNWTLGLSLAVQGITILSATLSSGSGPKAIGVVVALAQILLFIFRRWGKTHFGMAEQIRRLVMLHEGLGIQPSEDQLAAIWERVGNPQDAKPAYLDPYYESSAPKGCKRLIEITRESAFFTASLARSAAMFFWGAAITGLGAAFFALVVAIQTHANPAALEIVAKSVIASMAFWVTGDLVTMALQYSGLATAASRVQTQCAHLLSKAEQHADEVHPLTAEYNCAVIQAPPIPEWIYRWRQHVLNQAWRNRSGLTGVSSAA